ncbi:Prp 4 [Halenospora varia]|nr:Prp 4 [Halenospora varia]
MQFLSTLFLVSSVAAVATNNLSAGQLISLKALRSVVESRQTHFCTPVVNPTCETSCGPGYVTCIKFPTCYNPGKGDNCCSDGSYCPVNQYCTDSGCCPIGKTLAECGAKVTLATIAPPATTSSSAAPSTSSSAATTTARSSSVDTSSSSSAHTSSTAATSHASSSPAVTYASTPLPTPTVATNGTTTQTSPPVQVTAGAGKVGSELGLFALGAAAVMMAL